MTKKDIEKLKSILSKKSEEVKTEPKKAPKKLKRADLIKEYENIIMTKNDKAITEVLRKMGFLFFAKTHLFFYDEKERQKAFQFLKSKRKFNIEEFIEKFRKENCE